MQPREVLSVDEIKLSDIALWLRPMEEREGAFATLRRERPVSFHEEPPVPEGMDFPRGSGYWAITKHADILHVSRNPEIFCSGQGTNIGDLPEPFLEYFGNMINLDGERHARMRGIVSRGFTPRMIQRAEESVERAVAKIMDNVIEKGECDFVKEIAARLPLAIICDMMGIPESQHDFVIENSNAIIGVAGGDPEFVTDPADIIPRILGGGQALNELCKELAIERRKRPTDDLVSALVNSEIEGQSLTDEELGSFFVLLVVAGNETTRNAISHGMKALCDYPEQREIWARDFEGIAPTAVDEIIRWASPVLSFRRTATQDTEIRGQAISEGDKVVLWYNSGNRDEEVFENPFEFDVRRTPNEHVAFGGPGPHFCLGAHLARREVTIMFREIFRTLPDLEITSEPDRLWSNFVHGIKRMNCRFTPGGARA
jgi:cytochrome P450